MDTRLKKFLTKQYCLSLSVREPQVRESKENQKSKAFCGGVHSASCFYAFDEENLTLIIKSEPTTRHIQLAQTFSIVGINIAKSTLKLLAIKGAQIRAQFGNATKEQERLYYQKFPYAKALSGEIYALEILWAKYSDNKFFGKTKVEFFR
ncbi:hypothetical protein [Helicobacter sp. 23-1046]